MPIFIAALADMVATSLARTDVATLSQADTDALDRLAGAITWDLREQITARKRELWFEAAVTDPPAGSLTRTVIVSSPAPGDWLSAALIQRTDTGQHYIVSTSQKYQETLTWRCDEAGQRYPHPDVADCTENEVLKASGRGLSRAEALAIIDQAAASALMPGWPS
jgi:hypothetical protein